MAARSGVLVAGAINTDLVARVTRAPEAGETVTGSEFSVFGGGKGANQALAAVRSGARTTMLGAVGSDDFGRQRLANLQADGIDIENVVVTGEAASGVALIVVDAAGENRISYVPGATATISADQALAAYRRSHPATLLATLELPLAALDALFEVAYRDGVRVVLNATPEPANGHALLAYANTLIVNETEALELLGRESNEDWVALARQLTGLGPGSVVITLGSQGAVLCDADRAFHAPAPPVVVADTTGAGDAFCGAFAASLGDGNDVESALRAGIAAGSLAVTVVGAQRSMPRRADVHRLAEEIAVRRYEN